MPSVSAYSAGVRRIRSALPRAVPGAGKHLYMSPWNEPNHSAQPTDSRFRGAQRVASYTAYLRRTCKTSQDCTVVSPEFAITSTWPSYVKNYRTYLARRSAAEPRIWTFHPYLDVSNGVRGSRNVCPMRAASSLPRKCRAALRKSHTARFARTVRKGTSGREVWLSEVGSRVDNNRNTESSQNKEVDYLLRWLSRRANRVFYYHYWLPTEQDPANEVHDSGLIRPGPNDPCAGETSGSRVRCSGRRDAWFTFKSFAG
jgi:hypothetical protein